MAEIKRILVANRGEIALRAIRTIQEMGKEAVAVYSTADKDASYLQACQMRLFVSVQHQVPRVILIYLQLLLRQKSATVMLFFLDMDF